MQIAASFITRNFLFCPAMLPLGIDILDAQECFRPIKFYVLYDSMIIWIAELTYKTYNNKNLSKNILLTAP